MKAQNAKMKDMKRQKAKMEGNDDSQDKKSMFEKVNFW